MTATLLQQIAAAPDDAPALRGDAQWVTYGQLKHAAQRIGAVLHRNYGQDQYLLLRAPSTVDFVASLLGVMYSGNVPVPVDPELPNEGLDYIREKSHAPALLDPLTLADYADATPVDHSSPQRTALVLFTSGTSGFPKGVTISDANLSHSCMAISGYLDYHRYPSAAVALPLHYSYALLSQVCCQLFVGGRVRLFADFRNPLKFARAVEEDQLETFCGVPSTYQALVSFHGLSPLEMPSVRVLCSAGAAMDQSKYETTKKIFPGAVFFNNYGMTEASPRISFIRDDDPRFHEPTCGKPMQGVEIKIVDPRTHAELPDGEQGVLVVRGPNITAGYLNDEQQTARSYTADGFLISGDIAYRDDGYIFIRGRNDDIFNCGGEKIAPLEIERHLNHVEGVELSAVTGVSDELRGMTPVAFLKLRSRVTRKELVDALSHVLPKGKIPLRYIEVNGFPMTANGKLQRRRLSPDDPQYVIGEIR
jgi:acyl-CoA synthetase (AMP-forming)/AMP-acid ligase II